MIENAREAVSCGVDVAHGSHRKCGNYGEPYAPTFVESLADVEPSWPGEYMVTGDGRPPVAAELERFARDGWGVTYGGRWPVMRRPTGDDGSVGVRWWGSWIGERRVTSPAEAEHTWTAIARACRLMHRARPAPTPARLGRELWHRGIPEGVVYAVPSPELARWIRDASHQGRIEVLPGSGSVPIYEYDARTAYLAVLNGLPVGAPRLVVGERKSLDVDPYAPSRYLIDWRAPSGWDRCGVFREGGGYPLASTVAQWADGAEVHLARRNGWHIQVHAVVVWPARADPLRGWHKRLDDVRTVVPAGVDPLTWRNVWRSVELQTIGAFTGGGIRPRCMARTTRPPVGATAMGEGVFRWRREAVTDPGAHPEWSAAIWARARVRLLDCPSGGGEGAPRAGAWNVPAADVIGFRTDAIYTTCEQRGWVDDGAPGRFRLARLRTEARAWPENQAAMIDGLHRVELVRS
jgi:hypothetical protein